MDVEGVQVCLCNFEGNGSVPPNTKHLMMCECKPLWSPLMTDLCFHLIFAKGFFLGKLYC